MTLVLTEVSQAGIVMAADTAVTERFADRRRVLFGVRKLFAHDRARAGVGVWGSASLPVGGDPRRLIPAEYVLEELLHDCRMATSVTDVVRELTNRLNDRHRLPPAAIEELAGEGLKESDFVFGADVVGFVLREGHPLPAIYRVANASPPYSGQRLTGFHERLLRAPAPFDRDRDQLPMIGGDIYAGDWVASICKGVYHAAQEADLTDLPGPSLVTRRAWWASVARFLSDIYARGYGLRTIGSEVLTLGIWIDPDGYVQIAI